METILVIEENDALRDNLLKLLTIEGFQTIAARDGEAGIQLVQERRPDLVLCAITPPQMDGYQVLLTLRSCPETALIPVILLTTQVEQKILRRGMELGADDCLIKPFTREELIKSIAARLAKHRMTIALKQQVQKLRQLHEEKDSFMSTVIHDLRAPLINMTLLVEMLQRCEDDKRQEYLEILRTECNREMHLVEELLHLQTLDQQTKIPIPQEVLRLQNWLPELVSPFMLRARDRQQTLRLQTPPRIPSLKIGATQLSQLLTELLNNACKYTRNGGEIILRVETVFHTPMNRCHQLSISPANSGTLSLSRTGCAVLLPQPDLNDSPYICFTVSNSAEISPDALPHIFDRFYRVSNDPQEKQSAGLGLPLVRQLTDRLGGNIHVRSGNGWTHFTLCLPAEKVEQDFSQGSGVRGQESGVIGFTNDQ